MSAVAPHRSLKLTLLLVGMALLLLMAIAAGWSLQGMTDAAQESRHVSSRRMLILEKTINSLHMAETAQRGYLITSNPRHVASWQASASQANVHYQQLVAMYADEPVAAGLLVKLRRWIRMKLEDLEDSIEAQRVGGPALAETLTQADNGRRYMVQINEVIRELETIEATRNVALRSLVVSRRNATYGSAAVLFIVAVVACAVVHRLLRREAAARQHDAFHDALTALPNRRYLLEELDRSVLRAKRQGRVVALLFIDLDGFKRVNDSLGHEFGDVVLLRASERFTSAVRQSDFLARLGGDEFAVVMDAASRANAAALGSRLIASLRGPLIEEHADYRVSASIGVAVYPEEASDSAALLARADQAMYLAKRLGKSQVASLAIESNQISERANAVTTTAPEASTTSTQLGR